MAWYYIHNANKNITSTNPKLVVATYSFNVEIGGVDCGTCDKQYRSDASTIASFRNVKQRLILELKILVKFLYGVMHVQAVHTGQLKHGLMLRNNSQ